MDKQTRPAISSSGNPMLCPCCKSPLVITGMSLQIDRLEALDENAEGAIRDKAECINPTCYAYRRLFWSLSGELYVVSGSMSEDDQRTFYQIYRQCTGSEKVTTPFINNNMAPFGTIERAVRINDKKDENRDFYLLGGRFRLEIKYQYTADYDGEITSRIRKIRWWKRQEDGMYVMHTFGIHMIWFGVKHTYWNMKRLRTNTELPRDEIKKRLLRDHVQIHQNTDGWWRRPVAFINRMIIERGV
jgi:hypothetical protein